MSLDQEDLDFCAFLLDELALKRTATKDQRRHIRSVAKKLRRRDLSPETIGVAYRCVRLYSDPDRGGAHFNWSNDQLEKLKALEQLLLDQGIDRP